MYRKRSNVFVIECLETVQIWLLTSITIQKQIKSKEKKNI